jgi:hypothetical protein
MLSPSCAKAESGRAQKKPPGEVAAVENAQASPEAAHPLSRRDPEPISWAGIRALQILDYGFWILDGSDKDVRPPGPLTLSS